MEMNQEVIVDIPDNYTFNGVIVGKATTGIEQTHIVKCTDGFIPNDTYNYDTTVIPMCYIKPFNRCIKN